MNCHGAESQNKYFNSKQAANTETMHTYPKNKCNEKMLHVQSTEPLSAESLNPAFC